MWHFIITDPRLSAHLERDTPSKRPYLITREGTWVHNDDVDYILSLTRPGCCMKGGGMVNPAYHRARPTKAQLADKPSGG